MGGTLQLFERPQGGERAVLVGVGIGHPVEPNDIAEFAALAASAGTISVGTVLASRARPDPKYFVGSGKAEEIHAFAEAQRADLVLVDQTLSPSQERNLEKLTGRRVLDRNGLILDIFAQRARSFEGKLQVELAQLSHLATRLVRGWTHLERQKGGIGLRGPGETQLETDRRLIAKRIRTLRSRLEKLDRQRDTGRHVRREVPVPTVALVGYTNAGKSTLFNVLTGAETFVADQLFATLDPTVRRVKLADVGEVVLADTVGFVRALPHELIAAFRSTLQEAREADLLLHVVDASDPKRDERIEQVREVLRGIGAGDIRELLVFNKIDLSGDGARRVDGADEVATQVWVSAASGLGLDVLRAAMTRAVRPNQVRRTFHLQLQAAAVRSELYRRNAVRSERQCEDGSWDVEVELDRSEVAKLAGAKGVILLVPERALAQRVA
ncbi:MAG TPA: ribosome rescue GTPase HflX [Steroidobacteraceae bacterium]|nr:ribosome rescue GTPase HflX [Steroidobacteraceae bacterium]